MAIHILNLSVSIKDVMIDCITEDFTVNDQETDIESPLEKVNLFSYYSTKLLFAQQLNKIKAATKYLFTFHQNPIFDIFSPPPNA